MKSILAFIMASTLYPQGRSYAVAIPVIAGRSEETCGFTTVPLLRAYSARATDHFYTISASEMENAVTNDGYQSEGDAAQVFSSQVTNTIPLYRLWSPSEGDHFYTTSESERDNAALKLGYTYEGIAAYVFPSGQCGAVSLYRTYNPNTVDHFYTTNVEQRDHELGLRG